MQKNAKLLHHLASKGALRAWSLLLTFALSCLNWRDQRPQPFYGVVEYGMPHAEFHVMGTVHSATDSAAVPGIEMFLNDVLNSRTDTQITDAQGAYRFIYSGMCAATDLSIASRDIDGAANGSFVPADTLISIQSEELTEASGWNCGTVQKKVDVFLKNE